MSARASCVLCLANCGKEDNVATGTPIFIQRQLSYKMLLRYLKIDALKLGQLSSSFETFLDGGSDGGNANLEVLLCSNCSAVTNEFLELFQVFDEARLRLDEICGELLNRIREGEEDQGRLEEYRKSLKNVSQLFGKPVDSLLNASLAERLRNETKQKCSERLNKSIPKVTLSRGDSAKRRKIDSTISNETEIITEKIIKNENLVEDSNLELATDKSLSSQQVKIEAADPLPEDDNDSMETELLDTITFHRSEVEDESERGPPIQDQLTLSPSQTIGLPLSPESRLSQPEPILASSSSMEFGGKSHQGEKTCKERDYLREHMILVNLLITFAPRIPPNTTVVQVQTVVNSIAFGEKGILKKTDGKFSCTICSQKFPWANRLRTHIFLHHFNQVLDLLLGKVEVEVEKNPMLRRILENSTGNKRTSHDQHSGPLGNEEERMFQDIPQLADKDEETLDLEDPLMDTPIPPSSSSQQTKKPCPALNPIPTTLPPGILVPVTLTPTTTYHCSKCGKIFVSNEYLLKHKVEAHMDPNVLPHFFMCSKCRQMFRSKDLLGTHVKSTHTFEYFKNQLPPSTSEADFDQVINTFVLMRKALSSSGGGGTEDIVGCRICYGQYVLLSQRNQLIVHVMEKHFEMVASTIAQNLKKSGDRKGEVEEVDKCLCHICSRDFITDHSSTNANETVFECNYCGKLFPGRGNLRFHLVISHPIIVFSGELPPGTSESEFNKVVDNLDDKTTEGTGLQTKFECTFCPRRYAKRIFIRPHILHKHFDQILKHLGGGGIGGEEADQKPEFLEPPTPAESIQIGLRTSKPHSTSTTVAAPLLGNTFQLGTNNGMLSLFVMPPPQPGNN